jgi:hypothetical protein
MGSVISLRFLCHDDSELEPFKSSIPKQAKLFETMNVPYWVLVEEENAVGILGIGPDNPFLTVLGTARNFCVPPFPCQRCRPHGTRRPMSQQGLCPRSPEWDSSRGPGFLLLLLSRVITPATVRSSTVFATAWS